MEAENNNQSATLVNQQQLVNHHRFLNHQNVLPNNQLEAYYDELTNSSNQLSTNVNVQHQSSSRIDLNNDSRLASLASNQIQPPRTSAVNLTNQIQTRWQTDTSPTAIKSSQSCTSGAGSGNAYLSPISYHQPAGLQPVYGENNSQEHTLPNGIISNTRTTTTSTNYFEDQEKTFYASNQSIEYNNYSLYHRTNTWQCSSASTETRDSQLYSNYSNYIYDSNNHNQQPQQEIIQDRLNYYQNQQNLQASYAGADHFDSRLIYPPEHYTVPGTFEPEFATQRLYYGDSIAYGSNNIEGCVRQSRAQANNWVHSNVSSSANESQPNSNENRSSSIKQEIDSWSTASNLNHQSSSESCEQKAFHQEPAEVEKAEYGGSSRSLINKSLARKKINESLAENSIQRTNQCGVCGRLYARPSTLKTHLRTHTNERPFKCNVCLKTFSQAANLTAHQRVHTGERPFSCPICGRQFSQSSSVITHLRTHSGERPYRCSMCSRTFSDSSTLTKHCRIHSGEKPYQCDYCPLNFSQSGNLSRHLKLHLMNTSNAANTATLNSPNKPISLH